MRFRLLGSLEVLDGDHRLELGAPKQRAVLAILLLKAGEAVSAERLIDELWGERPPATATGTLQSYVSRLRKSLDREGEPARLTTTAGGYLLRVEPEELDAAVFERLVGEGRQALARGLLGAASARLAEALSLFRGPVLADAPPRGSLRGEVARFEELRLAVTEDRIDADLALGRHAELIPELEALVAGQPLRERMRVQLMLALYRSGRQADALQSYEELRKALVEELGIDPSPASQRVHQSILRHEADLEWRMQPAREAAPSERAARRLTAFVGRERELAELRRFLGEATKGRGSVTLVGGRPGIGKTRIASEVTREAAEFDIRVATGHCHDAAGALPYAPFVEILERLGRELDPGELRQALGDEAAELARLLPELRVLFPDIPAPLDLPPEQERRRLFTGVTEFLARAARARPLFLVLEDLHWADEPTLALLAHLARRMPSIPALVLGTYRDVEPELTPMFTSMLADLHSERLANTLALGPLSFTDATSMVQALCGRTPPQPLVRTIHAATEGVPFFIEEVFEHLSEEGKIFDAQGEFRTAPEIGELDVPRGARIVIGRRLARLGEGTRRALLVAAVIGRTFDYRVLANLGEIEEDALLDALEEAVRAGLLTLVGDPIEARFAFAHELIRQTLLVGAAPPRLQRFHLRVADTIERIFPEHLDRLSPEIADHLYRAGDAADRARTLRYLRIAGEQALESAAYEEAVRHYERALSLQTPSDRAGRASLLFDVGMARRSNGDPDGALDAWREALGIFDELGDRESAGRLGHHAARELVRAFRHMDAVEMIGRGLNALSDVPNRDRAALLGLGGSLFGLGGLREAAEPMIEEAVTLAHRFDDRALLGDALTYEAVQHGTYWRFASAAATAERAADLLRSEGRLWELSELLSFLQFALVMLGRFDDAAKVSDELRPLAERLGHHSAALDARRNRAALEVIATADLATDAEAAGAELEAALRISDPSIDFGYSRLGISAFRRGAWDEARTRLEEAVQRELPGAYRGFGASVLVLLEAHEGRAEAVALILEDRPLAKPGEPAPFGAWLMALSAAEAFAVLGERDRAAALYPVVREAGADGVALRSHFEGRLIETVAGVAAAAGGLYDEAEEHFRTALRRASEIPNGIDRPDALRFFGRMLAERGSRDEARLLLTDAREEYRRLGMPRHDEMTRALLNDL